MNTLPYEFCHSVLKNLSDDSVDHMRRGISENSQIWKDAAWNTYRYSIKLFVLVEGGRVQYFFAQHTNCEGVLKMEDNYSVEALADSGLIDVRITEVFLGDAEQTKLFAKDGAWDADFQPGSPLRTFVVRHLHPARARMNLNCRGGTNDDVMAFFSELYFEIVDVTYTSSASEEFLMRQLENDSIRQLLLHGSWPKTAKKALDAYISSHSLQYVHLSRHSTSALSFDTLKAFAKHAMYAQRSIEAPVAIPFGDFQKRKDKELNATVDKSEELSDTVTAMNLSFTNDDI